MEVAGESRPDVLVVGAGASAVLLVRALRAAGVPAGTAIAVVGDGPEPGRGVAYSTPDPGHLLNVRAGRLSVDAADRDHFVAWLARNGYGGAAGDYVSRQVYGAYLADALDEVRRDPALTVDVVDGVVEELQPWSDGIEARLADGQTMVAQHVVLASGPPPGPAPT